jgi:hypothetical protein
MASMRLGAHHAPAERCARRSAGSYLGSNSGTQEREETLGGSGHLEELLDEKKRDNKDRMDGVLD